MKKRNLFLALISVQSYNMLITANADQTSDIVTNAIQTCASASANIGSYINQANCIYGAAGPFWGVNDGAYNALLNEYHKVWSSGKPLVSGTIPNSGTKTIPSTTPNSDTKTTPSTIPNSGTKTIPSTTPNSGTKTTPGTTPNSDTKITPSTTPNSGTKTTPSTTPNSGTSATPATLPITQEEILQKCSNKAFYQSEYKDETACILGEVVKYKIATADSKEYRALENKYYIVSAQEIVDNCKSNPNSNGVNTTEVAANPTIAAIKTCLTNAGYQINGQNKTDYANLLANPEYKTIMNSTGTTAVCDSNTSDGCPAAAQKIIDNCKIDSSSNGATPALTLAVNPSIAEIKTCITNAGYQINGNGTSEYKDLLANSEYKKIMSSGTTPSVNEPMAPSSATTVKQIIDYCKTTNKPASYVDTAEITGAISTCILNTMRSRYPAAMSLTDYTALNTEYGTIISTPVATEEQIKEGAAPLINRCTSETAGLATPENLIQNKICLEKLANPPTQDVIIPVITAEIANIQQQISNYFGKQCELKTTVPGDAYSASIPEMKSQKACFEKLIKQVSTDQVSTLKDLIKDVTALINTKEHPKKPSEWTPIVQPFADITMYYSPPKNPDGTWPAWSSATSGSLGALPDHITKMVKDSGIGGIRYAFITDNGPDKPMDWAGNKLDFAQASVKALQAAGKKVAISFGGQSGKIPGASDKTVDAIYAKLKQVQVLYPNCEFDFDIEQAAMVDNKDQLQKIMSATKRLQDETGIVVTLTLPVLPAGLNKSPGGDLNTCVAVAKAAGLDFNVNIMAMDYGDSACANSSTVGVPASCATQSIVSTASQTGLPYSKIGVTPMIGQNDQTDLHFTLDDAKTVAQFAKVNGMNLVSYWSLTRDHSGTDLNTNAQNTSAGMQTADFDYAKAFEKGLTGSLPANLNPTKIPVPSTPSTASTPSTPAAQAAGIISECAKIQDKTNHLSCLTTKGDALWNATANGPAYDSIQKEYDTINSDKTPTTEDTGSTTENAATTTGTTTATGTTTSDIARDVEEVTSKCALSNPTDQADCVWAAAGAVYSENGFVTPEYTALVDQYNKLHAAGK